MNLNLKMTVERLKRRSQFLSLVFITKNVKSCITNNGLCSHYFDGETRSLFLSLIFVLKYWLNAV